MSWREDKLPRDSKELDHAGLLSLSHRFDREVRTDRTNGFERSNVRYIDEISRPGLSVGCDVDCAKFTVANPCKYLVRAYAPKTRELWRSKFVPLFGSAFSVGTVTVKLLELYEVASPTSR